MVYVQGGLIEATDFNAFQVQVLSVYGIGFGDSGYGQTSIALPTVSGGLIELIKSVEWTNMRNILEVCGNHQDSGISLPTIGEVAVAALIQAHPPATGDIPSAISTIINQRLAYANAAVTLFVDELVSTRSTSWGDTTTPIISHTFQATFPSVDDARYFFNSGGQIRIRGSLSGGSSTPQNDSWIDLLNDMGSVVFAGDTTTTTNQGVGSLIGYYQLTSVNQLIYVITPSAGYLYDTTTIEVYARTVDGPTGANGDNGSIIEFTVNYDDTSTSTSDVVDGTISSNVDMQRATAFLTINAPVFSTITGL